MGIFLRLVPKRALPLLGRVSSQAFRLLKEVASGGWEMVTKLIFGGILGYPVAQTAKLRLRGEIVFFRRLMS
jgi:hypothetical protein